jgi:hypothetical protein
MNDNTAPFNIEQWEQQGRANREKFERELELAKARADAELPIIVTHEGLVWVRPPGEATYLSPVKRELDQAIRIRDTHGETMTRDERGKAVPLKQVLEKYAVRAESIARDFAARDIRFDRDEQRIIAGYQLPPVLACEDADAHAWLAALFGDGLDDALDWIVACKPELTHELAACLVIVGPKDLGKSLVFQVLARMWGAEQAPSLRDAIAQFNGPLEDCPIILDDECEALESGDVTADWFMTSTQRRSRAIERKGREKTILLGAHRHGITTNDIGKIRFAGAAGPDSIDAIADRIALHVVPAERTAAARAALGRLRPDLRSNDVDLDRLASHFAWLWESRTPRVQRFLGGRADASVGRATALRGAMAKAPTVFDAIESFLASGGADACGGAVAGVPERTVIGQRGRLYVRPAGFAYGHPRLEAVQEALVPFRKGAPRAVRIGKHGEVAKLWELDLDRLALVMGDLDADAVSRAVGAFEP